MQKMQLQISFQKNDVEKECKEEGNKQTTICKNLSENIKSGIAFFINNFSFIYFTICL